jgi:hypothetical protein
MKHNCIYLFFFSFAMMLLPEQGYTTQWTVSNDPVRPAQFSNIPAAVNAAANGDTILIAGSQNQYTLSNALFIQKKLILIGEGVNNPDGFNTTIYGSNTIFFGRLNATQSCDNSKIIGIDFQVGAVQIDGYFVGSQPEQRVISNVEFIGCRFGSGCNINWYDNYNNCKMINCLFINTGPRPYVSSVLPNNFIISNSVFSDSYVQSNLLNLENQVKVLNCVFLNRTSDCLINVVGINVENCIFYKAEPTGATNSLFNNNLTYLCNNNALPPAGTGNTGSDNIVNSNPLFNNYPLLGEAFSWAHNYGLQPGSPAIDEGTGVTDIGLTGGDYGLNQLKGNSPLPVVTSLSLPNSSVPINGTLQGNIKAKVRN